MKTWLRVCVLALSIGIMTRVLFLAGPGIADAASTLQKIRPLFLIASALLEIASIAALVQLYRSTLVLSGTRLSYRSAVPVTMGGFTVSRIFPGGAATAAVFMSRGFTLLGADAAAATGSVVVAGTLGMLVLGAIVSFGSLGSLLRGDLSVAYTISVVTVTGLFAAATLLGLWALRSERVRAKLVGSIEPISARLLKRNPVAIGPFVDELVRSFPKSGLVSRPLAWSATNWLADIAALWLLFFGFSYHVHLGVIIVGYGVANLLTALPITPGGLGLVEAGLTGTYVAFGVTPHVAVVVVLSYRLISYWLPVIAGIPAYLREVRKGRAVLEQAEVNLAS